MSAQQANNFINEFINNDDISQKVKTLIQAEDPSTFSTVASTFGYEASDNEIQVAFHSNQEAQKKLLTTIGVDASPYFSGELSDEELEAVSGGGMGNSNSEQPIINLKYLSEFLPNILRSYLFGGDTYA